MPFPRVRTSEKASLPSALERPVSTGGRSLSVLPSSGFRREPGLPSSPLVSFGLLRERIGPLPPGAPGIAPGPAFADFEPEASLRSAFRRTSKKKGEPFRSSARSRRSAPKQAPILRCRRNFEPRASPRSSVPSRPQVRSEPRTLEPPGFRKAGEPAILPPFATSLSEQAPILPPPDLPRRRTLVSNPFPKTRSGRSLAVFSDPPPSCSGRGPFALRRR